MRTGVVIVAAGSGKRMGGQRNKLWLPLAGEPILAHTVRLFAAHQDVDQIVLVVSEQDHADVLKWLKKEAIRLTVVLGGAERQDSVRSGLGALSENCTYVLVHDAARPFVTREQITAYTNLSHRLETSRDEEPNGQAEEQSKIINDLRERFIAEMDDDLNTANAIILLILPMY